MSNKKPTLVVAPDSTTSMIAGASAGIVVDLLLYPLDTIKTRLQSQQGFFNTGGFRGVYKGLAPVILASGPTSALFFISYNKLVTYGEHVISNPAWHPFVLVCSASCAEVMSATLRVPVEVIKQRKQVSANLVTNLDIIRNIMTREGFKGLYRGFFSTLTREVPFAAIQFPLWEYFKEFVRRVYLNGQETTPFQTACCGAVAGGCAAALTTPNDVIKTRIMLADTETIKRLKGKKYNIWMFIARDTYNESGARGLFKGVIPRVLWITLGGFIFFGVYDQTKVWCSIKNEDGTRSFFNPCYFSSKDD